MTAIVKVQLAIGGHGAGEKVLIYDQSRSRMQEQPLSSIPETARRHVRRTLKAYFRATWSEHAGWQIGEKVRDRLW